MSCIRSVVFAFLFGLCFYSDAMAYYFGGYVRGHKIVFVDAQNPNRASRYTMYFAPSDDVTSGDLVTLLSDNMRFLGRWWVTSDNQLLCWNENAKINGNPPKCHAVMRGKLTGDTFLYPQGQYAGSYILAFVNAEPMTTDNFLAWLDTVPSYYKYEEPTIANTVMGQAMEAVGKELLNQAGDAVARNLLFDDGELDE